MRSQNAKRHFLRFSVKSRVPLRTAFVFALCLALKITFAPDTRAQTQSPLRGCLPTNAALAALPRPTPSAAIEWPGNWPNANATSACQESTQQQAFTLASVTGTVLSGFYDSNGARCANATNATAQCPFQLQAFFRPTCPPEGTGVNNTNGTRRCALPLSITFDYSLVQAFTPPNSIPMRAITTGGALLPSVTIPIHELVRAQGFTNITGGGIAAATAGGGGGSSLSDADACTLDRGQVLAGVKPATTLCTGTQSSRALVMPGLNAGRHSWIECSQRGGTLITAASPHTAIQVTYPAAAADTPVRVSNPTTGTPFDVTSTNLGTYNNVYVCRLPVELSSGTRPASWCGGWIPFRTTTTENVQAPLCTYWPLGCVPGEDFGCTWQCNPNAGSTSQTTVTRYLTQTTATNCNTLRSPHTYASVPACSQTPSAANLKLWMNQCDMDCAALANGTGSALSGTHAMGLWTLDADTTVIRAIQVCTDTADTGSTGCIGTPDLSLQNTTCTSTGNDDIKCVCGKVTTSTDLPCHSTLSFVGCH